MFALSKFAHMGLGGRRGASTPTFFGVSTSMHATNGANITPSYPASVLAGDIAVVFGIGLECTINVASSGYTSLVSNFSGSPYTFAFWKRLTSDGQAAGQFSLTHDNGAGEGLASAFAMIFRGCKPTGTPIEAEAISTNSTCPTIVTLAARRLVAQLYIGWRNTTTDMGAQTPTAGWDERFDTQSTTLISSGAYQNYETRGYGQTQEAVAAGSVTGNNKGPGSATGTRSCAFALFG